MSAPRRDRPPPRRLQVLLAVLAVLVLLLVLRWAWPERRPTGSPPPTRAARPELDRPTLGEPLPDAPDDPRLVGLPRLDRLWLRPFSSVVVEELDNGLTVFVVPRPDADRVAVRVVVRAGAADDEVPGVAHLLEHLLFRGTPSLGTEDWVTESAALAEVEGLLLELSEAPDDAEVERALRAAEVRAARPVISGESSKLLAAIGASRVNGTTTHDATTFQMLVPPDVLDRWARFELDRFTEPALRQFRTERKIVVDEVVRRSSHASADARGRLRALLYPYDPYGVPVGGTPESVGGSVPDDARAFFEDWYVPRSMAVVLAGPIDPAEAIALVERTLGTLPDRPPPPRPPRPLRIGRGDDEAGGPADHVGWVLPPTGPEERAALEVAAALLADHLDGDPAWYEVDAVVHPTARSTEVTVTGRCLPDRRPGCRPALRSVVERLSARAEPACVVAAAAALARSRAAEALEGVEGHAEAVAEAWIRGESLPDLRATLLAYGTVGPEAVRAAAARLDPGRVAWVEATGHAELAARIRPTRSALPKGDGPSELYDVLTSDLPPPALGPGPSVVEAEDGSVVLVQNPIDARYRAAVHFAGGWLADPLRCRAVRAMQLPISVCSPGIPPGTTLSTRCDATDTWLVLEGDVGSAGQAVAGVLNHLRAWSPDALDPSAAIRSELDEVKEVAQSAVYEVRPLPPPARGVPELKELARALGRLGEPDQLLVGGALTLDEVSTWTPLAPLTPPVRRALRRVDVPTVVVSPSLGSARLLWPLPTHRPADEPVLAWLSAWWGGMDGAFFRELREDRGRSYVAGAEIVRDPVRGVYVVATGGTSRDLLAVGQQVPTEEDFERVRGVALRRLTLGPSWREAAAEHATWQRLGFPDGDRDAAAFDGLRTLRRDDVTRYLAGAGRPIVGVSALSAEEEAALRASGVAVERRAAVAPEPGR